MIELGLLFFGGLTGNLALCIGWILVNTFNLIPEEYELLSVAGVIVIAISRKFLRVTEVT